MSVIRSTVSKLTEHGRPGLVDDIETYTSAPAIGQKTSSKPCSQFIDVGVEDLVHEPDAGRLVGELLRELDMNLPDAVREWRCIASVRLVVPRAPLRRH